MSGGAAAYGVNTPRERACSKSVTLGLTRVGKGFADRTGNPWDDPLHRPPYAIRNE
jgi:hypothetical protein